MKLKSIVAILLTTFFLSFQQASSTPTLTHASFSVTETVWTTSPDSAKNMLTVPKTNCEIRLWYNYQVVAIGVINKRWEEAGISLHMRAYKAYEMRHAARVNARYMMQDKDEVKALQERDQAKYGNPDGPTFEYLMQKMIDKGKTVAEAYQAIIDSSSTTDTAYNADCE